MTRGKRIALINELRRLRKEVAELRDCRNAVLTGAAQATLSSGTGSKSYTNWRPEDFDRAIAKDLEEIAALNRTLGGRGAFRIDHATVRRS